jgi:hypothetical protein
MNIKTCAIRFLYLFGIVFVVSVVVSYLYSALVHGEGIIDWGNAVRQGIILGIVLAWVQSKDQ